MGEAQSGLSLRMDTLNSPSRIRLFVHGVGKSEVRIEVFERVGEAFLLIIVGQNAEVI
jgi:hypothetical protein